MADTASSLTATSAAAGANPAAPNLAAVKTFLMNALSSRMSGDTAQYNLIVKQLKIREDEESVWQVLLGLNSFVSNFTQRPDIFSDLLNSIFTYDWKGGARIDAATASLVEDIASANATFLPAALHMLVQSLLPAPGTVFTDGGGELPIVDKKEVVHKSIRRIIQQAPMGQSLLLSLLVEAYPFKRFSCAVQAGYVTQLLRICEYLPGIQADIVELIVSKCLEMDVEIVIEESGDVCLQQDGNSDNMERGSGVRGGEADGYDDDDDTENIFQFDEEDAMMSSSYSKKQQRGGGKVTSSSSTKIGIMTTSGSIHSHLLNNNNNNSKNDGSQRIAEEVSELADKLDTSLCLLVSFLEEQMRQQQLAELSSNALLKTRTSRIYPQLLSVFEKSIFPTYKSKFTQFLVFFLASKNEAFSKRLADQLLRTLGNEMASALKRQCAVMYLASYLARANFLSPTMVSDTLEKLLNWASNYLAALPPQYQRRTTATAAGSTSHHPAIPVKQESADAATTTTTTSGMRTGISGGGGNIGGHVFEVEMYADFDQFGQGVPQQASSSIGGAQEQRNLHARNGVGAGAGVGGSHPPPPKQHSSLLLLKHELFYAVVQAVCYALCFHGTEMATLQRMNPALKVQWESIVSSPLDPLRYCLRTVRVEFLKLAAYVGLFSDECWEAFAPDLAFIDELRGSGVAAAVAAAAAAAERREQQQLAGGGRGGVDEQQSTKTTTTSDHTTTTTTTTTTGNRILLTKLHIQQQQQQQSQRNGAAAARSAGASYGRMDKATGTNPLDSFFPFDPCLLAKLHRRIDGCYRPWSGVPGLPVHEGGGRGGGYSSDEDDEYYDDYDRECLDDESVSFVDDEEDLEGEDDDEADNRYYDGEDGGGGGGGGAGEGIGDHLCLEEEEDYVVVEQRQRQQQQQVRGYRSRSGSSNLLRSGSEGSHVSGGSGVGGADEGYGYGPGGALGGDMGIAGGSLHSHILQELSRNRQPPAESAEVLAAIEGNNNGISGGRIFMRRGSSGGSMGSAGDLAAAGGHKQRRKALRSGSIGNSRAVPILNGNRQGQGRGQQGDGDYYVSRSNSYTGSSLVSSLAYTPYGGGGGGGGVGSPQQQQQQQQQKELLAAQNQYQHNQSADSSGLLNDSGDGGDIMMSPPTMGNTSSSWAGVGVGPPREGGSMLVSHDGPQMFVGSGINAAAAAAAAAAGGGGGGTLPRRLSGELLQLNHNMYTAAAAANGGSSINRNGASLGPYFNSFAASGHGGGVVINPPMPPGVAGGNGLLASSNSGSRPPVASALTAGLIASASASDLQAQAMQQQLQAQQQVGVGTEPSPSGGKRRPRQYSIGSTGSW